MNVREKIKAAAAAAGNTGKIRTAAVMFGIVLSCSQLTGCAQLESTAASFGLIESPYYHLGDTEWDHGGIEEYYFNQIPSELNEIYRELYSRISSYEDSATLYAQVPTEDFWTAYYAVLADHPEFFWVGSNIEVQESALSGKVASYQLTVTTPADERPATQARLEEAADACISGIDPAASDYEKIKYVYEYIINTTDYGNNSLNSQNIQSALLDRVSVCAGYARAFQYILHRMGMFCTYVTGYTSSGGDHAWNIVRIDGQYYNVDVTWGDPVFTGESGETSGGGMNYNYLCCTDEMLSRTHTVDTSVPMPACTDNSYDYFVRNGMYYTTFDYDTIHNALMNSVWAWSSRIDMKFENRDAYDQAVYNIFQCGMLEEPAAYLMQETGASSWNYSYHTDDDCYVITIIWGI